MEIVIASKNLHKVRELKNMLKDSIHLDLLSLHDFPGYEPPEENGETFKDNALLKAKHAAETLNKWAIGDDSGLVVPILNGLPGVISARWAGPKCSDSDNRQKLLNELRGKSGLERSAYLECCLALCSPEGAAKTVRGICEGVIAVEERGKYGFGYDPIFLKHDYIHTFGELEDSVKNRVSHRRKALDKLLLLLESF